MKIKRKTFLGGIIATICACATVITGLSLSGANGKTVANAATIKSSAAYLDLNGSGNILNGFEGKQQEYVYFGKNGNTPVKWRVLSKNGSSYGNGMLLWADKQLAAEPYNPYYFNPDYSFWGTSQIRAQLNGGIYYSGVSNTADPSIEVSVDESASWYGKLFNKVENKAVEEADSYVTDHWTVDVSQSQWLYLKEGITATADGVNGKWNINRINATTHPSSKYAIVTSSNGVQETTSGDKLFLLDYYDINNTNYGFGDSGVTYAKKVNPSWTPSSNWYPGYFDGANSAFNGITSNYLKYSGEASPYYWLRSSGHLSSKTASDTLVVSDTGFIAGYGAVGPYGVRPAFNMDTTKIAYATTEIPGNAWANMTNVPTTPGYKLYLKDGDYSTNSGNAKAIIGVKDNALQIKYNNPVTASGEPVKDGNLIVLLSSKSATGGEVDYQQAIAMDANATSSKSVLTSVSLPAGVSLDTHDLTLLYTTNNGGYSTDNIYCKYAISEVDAPQNITVTYDGNSKWITDLTASEKPAWLDLDIYNNTAYMSVKSVEYTDNLAADNPDKKTNEPVTTDDIVSAGTYKVTMTLASDLKWTGETAAGGDKSFNIVIKKAQPTVEVQTTGTLPTYAPDKLSEIGIGLKSGGTAGTVKWKDGDQRPAVGKNDYYWVFTPADTNNYEGKTDKLPLTFSAREIDKVEAVFTPPEGGVFTNTTEATLRNCTVVTITYKGTPVKTEVTTNYEFIIDNDGENTLVEGDNYFKVRVFDANAGNKKVTSALVKIEDVKKLGYESIDSLVLSKTFTYPVTADDIIASITSATLNRNDGDSAELTDKEEIKKIIVISDGADFNAGTGKSFSFKIAGMTEEKTYGGFTIKKGTLTPTVTFANDTVTYDGSAHKIEATVTGLPTGVTLTPAYTVTGSSTNYDAAGYTDAGTYNYSVTFTHTDPNYEQYTTASTATLQIDQATVTGIVFNNVVKPEVTGTTYTAADIAATGVPSWVTVKYLYNGAEFSGVSAAGTYTITARFTHDDPNYEQIADKTITLTISNKPPVEGADDIVVEATLSAVYNGLPVDYSAKNVPSGVDVTYKILRDGAAFDGTEITDAGVYTITVKFEVGADKMPIADKTCVVTIAKADYDMTGVTFEDKTVTYDGENHTLTIMGSLPTGVSVAYYVGETPFTGATEIGEYEIVAKFNHYNANYNAIADMTAKLTISDAVVTGVSATVDGAAKFDINNTLDDLKKVISAEVEYNNGTKEAVEVDKLTLTCDTLRDGGKFEVGTQTITITYNDGTKDFTTTVEIVVAKAKVALPVYKGTLSYTGLELKPTANDFDGYNADIMTFNETKTVAGLNAGAYKAVFALKDSDRYEWATTTTTSKKLFAAAVFDGEISIDPTFEAAVDWNIAKAKISATKAEGKLPVFASESFTGSLGEVIALKYYTDETCTEEVAADALSYNTNYYVRAVLSDEAKANFELDETSLVFAAKPFEYLTPEKELTFWEKVVKFLTSKQMGLVVWLWIVIALVALILLITIIALAAKSRKKKRIREERRLAEEKEEKEREREERRLEREERMARMSQQQAMPQMMLPQMMPQMPMQQPQYAPQSQPMAMGGGSNEAQFMQMQAELAAVKAEQAAMRAEQNAVLRSDMNAMRNDYMMDKSGGTARISSDMSAEKLAEIITAAVKSALADETKPAPTAAATPENSAASAAPVAPQVPPDAVMTTVTTTKIDTTKKAQGTHDTAQAARPTRSFVPPMPVDDGRVFDVGGFYKPADPATDFNFDEDEKKD